MHGAHGCMQCCALEGLIQPVHIMISDGNSKYKIILGQPGSNAHACWQCSCEGSVTQYFLEGY
jgi:hypothetical protein